MDYHALQQKLFEMDPTDPREDLAKLQAAANGGGADVPPAKDYVAESVEVPQGSMPLGIDSVADFAALAGVRLDEKYKKGQEGQLKGKDAFKKASKPGPGPETPHPARGKLVGEADDTPEFKSAYDLAKNSFKKYNTLGAMKGRIAGNDGSKDTKAGNVNTPAEKPATKGKDQKSKNNFPSGIVDGALYQIKPGDNVAYVNAKGKANAGIVTVMLDTKDKKGHLQIQLKNRGAVYAIDRGNITHVNGKDFKLKDEGAGTGSIKDSLYAALEASKKQPSLKPRDPSAQTMQDLRKSGAMGAHKDKKKLAKQGYQKHKGKMNESFTKVDGTEAEQLRKEYAKDWEIRKNTYLYKKVAFDDYNTVLRFLMIIEKPQVELDHFADIKFFYNEATLVIYTHDTKGLTTLDFKLAVQIDKALDKMGAKEIG